MGMLNKKIARKRRGKKTRARIQKLGVVRLSVCRSLQHMYAQVFSDGGKTVLAAASTLEKEICPRVNELSKIEAAKTIGKLIAERAKQKGIVKVAFDRSGFAYHGRVKALAEGAREAGLEF